MTDQTEIEDIAYYNFVAAFRREHKRFPRPEEAWIARAALDTAPDGKVDEEALIRLVAKSRYGDGSELMFGPLYMLEQEAQDLIEERISSIRSDVRVIVAALRTTKPEGKVDDWRRLAVVAIGFLGLTSKRLGEGWQAHSTISAIEEFLKAHGNVAALRTTKPADDGQLVAFAEWLSGRSPETFWVTAVDERGPSYMDAKEAVTWFLMQQKGERSE